MKKAKVVLSDDGCCNALVLARAEVCCQSWDLLGDQEHGTDKELKMFIQCMSQRVGLSGRCRVGG